jgi:ribonuclease HI
MALICRKGQLMIETVTIFTDGACQGNPGPGGWGVILRYKGVEKELSGFNPDTTNNRMELQAAIEGIKVLKRSVKVDLYTDSQYVRNGITKWLLSWKQNNWRLSDRSPVKNKDLWEELDALVQTHHISWHWVKGHSGHPENERADALAVQAIKDALKKNLRL